MDMEEVLPLVTAALQKQGIVLRSETAKKHTYQGWMSTVFTVESSAGALIIHSARLIEEHVKNKVWEKFAGIKDILAAHPSIPAPEIHYAGFHDGFLLLVQKYIA